MNTLKCAEYLWIDGSQPTQQLRSKARVLELPDNPRAADLPEWSFDGSSTEQSAGDDSDCILAPVRVYADPFRGPGSVLVLCEVRHPDGRDHQSNRRADLWQRLADGGSQFDPWLGFEQEYTLFRGGRPLGFPENGYPGPQGPYYCGAGAGVVFGREVVEAHLKACINAGVMIYGVNAEVMPGQWEFQIGYRGAEGETSDPLRAADDLWVGRYLLHRISEQYDVCVSFDNKPMKGDWNGAGMHTNLSTIQTRDPRAGSDAIESLVAALELMHDEHIVHYGDRLDERLTGMHETCDIGTFRSGIANRGASIRIPLSVASKGYGYLEDRRPGANADPYTVASCLIDAVTASAKAAARAA